MPSRRFHTKRRHGCKQCKARRVRCNAGAPCQHCARREEHCSNQSLLPNKAFLTPSSPSALQSSRASLSEVKRLSTCESGITLLGISHLELRLLDHYCNFVAPIISPHDHLRRMWQAGIPQHAKSHSFLMHSILSTSAYHLSCAYARPLQRQQERSQDVLAIKEDVMPVPASQGVSPDYTEWQTRQSNRYERYALDQQRLAFYSYIPNLSALNSQNHEALCAATVLLSINAVASTQNRYTSPALESQHASPIDDWLEISILVRGVDAITRNDADKIVNGPLQPLYSYRHIEPSNDSAVGDVESQVKRIVSPYILSALDELAPAIEHCTSSEADKEILQAALVLLRASFAVVAVNPEHDSVVMVWSNLLDAHFFPLVKRREPMALILLAYSMVLLKKFRDRWWVGELSTKILRDVAGLLTLLDERDEEQRSEQVVEGDCARTHSPLQRYSDGASVPTAGMAKWTHLLEWPLRESRKSGASCIW